MYFCVHGTQKYTQRSENARPKGQRPLGRVFLGVEREPVGQRVIFVDEERAAAGLIGRAGDLDAHGGEAPDLLGGDGLPREALTHEVILRRLLTDGEPAAVDEVGYPRTHAGAAGGAVGLLALEDDAVAAGVAGGGVLVGVEQHELNFAEGEKLRVPEGRVVVDVREHVHRQIRQWAEAFERHGDALLVDVDEREHVPAEHDVGADGAVVIGVNLLISAVDERGDVLQRDALRASVLHADAHRHKARDGVDLHDGLRLRQGDPALVDGGGGKADRPRH